MAQNWKPGTMKTLGLYLVREVIKGSLSAAAVLLALVNFFALTDELDDLGRGDYDLTDLLHYLVLISPQNFYELLPSSALLGSLITLGNMTQNYELVAMRVLGLSIRHLVFAALTAGLLLSAIGVVVGETIAPEGQQAAAVLKATAQHRRVALRSRYGLWLRDGYSFVHIGRVDQVDRLAQIYFYELDAEHRLRSIEYAAEAVYKQDGWRLLRIERTELEGNTVSAQHMSQRPWPSGLDPELLSIVVVKPDELSSHELWRYIRYLRTNDQKSQPFEIALWSRILNPVTTLVMLALSLPLVIRPPRDFPLGRRLLVGAVLGLSFHLLNRICGHVGVVYQLHPALAATLPLATFASAGAYALNRANRY